MDLIILSYPSISMNKPLPKKITIYLSLEQDIFCGYFNPQDPAPLYKRQLSHEFEEYIITCTRAAKRESEFSYKVSYRDEANKHYVEPLTYAIRRHFAEEKAIAQKMFGKFKQRTYALLFISIAVVMICQGFLPLLFDKENHNLQSGLINSLDVLCWVILWKPIERLIFYWNPYLKDISILERLEKAEVNLSEITD